MKIIGQAKWSKRGRGFGFRRGWEYQDHFIVMRTHGPLPHGAVVLNDKGETLSLHNGVVYIDARFIKEEL